MSPGADARPVRVSFASDRPAMMDSETGGKAATLLGLDEPPAVETTNTDGSGSAVLVCDHASNRVPERLGTLGLEPDLLADHIGWAPGAADVTRRLGVLPRCVDGLNPQDEPSGEGTVWSTLTTDAGR